jgi:acyl carrier protein
MRHSRWCVVALLVLLGCAPDAGPGKGPSRAASPESAEDAVRAVLAQQFKVDASSIAMDKPISDPPLKADDLDVVEIVMELEERLDISIPDDAMDRRLGKDAGKWPQITPNQLAAVVRECPKSQTPNQKQ